MNKVAPFAILLTVFVNQSCSLARDKEVATMNSKATLTVKKVVKGDSGNMIIVGAVINERRSAVLIPWLGEPGSKDGVIITTLGSLDIKEEQGWKMISGLKDGIRPLVALSAGNSVSFSFPTRVPFSEKRRRYRFTMPNMRSVEFRL